MKNFLKHYSLLIFLLFLIIVLILVKIFYGNNSEVVKNNLITPTPTLNLVPTETIQDRDNYGADPEAVSLVPYVGKKMIIDKYIKTGVLEVLIKKEEDKPEAELEVQEWLKISGYKTGEIEFVYKISDF